MVKLHTMNHMKWHKKDQMKRWNGILRLRELNDDNMCEYFAQSISINHIHTRTRAFLFRTFFCGSNDFLFLFFRRFFFEFANATHQRRRYSTFCIWMPLTKLVTFLYFNLFKLCHEKWRHEAASATAPLNAKYDSDWARILWLYVRYATPEPIQNTDIFVRLLAGGSKPLASKNPVDATTISLWPCMNLRFAQNMLKLSWNYENAKCALVRINAELANCMHFFSSSDHFNR